MIKPFNSAVCCYINSLMTTKRPYSALIDRLKAVNLRPTRQRLALAKLLFEQGNRHVTAEQLHGEAMESNIKVSLATIYNTLNQFTAAGLLREVVVEPGRSYFDTNMEEHHHFFYEGRGQLVDIPQDAVKIDALPVVPEDAELRRVDVIIRVGERTA